MFISHTNSLKNNEYFILDQYNRERVLVNDNGYSMVSNICPHQKSLISSELGKGNRRCAYHGWEFSINGAPINSGRTASYCINDKELKSFPVYEWSNLLFDSEVKFDKHFDFSNLILAEQRIDMVNSSTKNIMNIFLDVDHIPVVHKDVYENIGFETVDTVEWTYYNDGNIQDVQGKAIWIAIYPNIMIEWQLGSLFITVAIEKEKDTSAVHVFKYRNKDNSDYEWHFNEKTWETSWKQDKDQAERMLTEYSNNLEEQKIHYKNWLIEHGFTSK